MIVRFYRANESLVVLSFTIMLIMMGFGMTTPITPLFARELGASVTLVGFVISAYGLARFSANMPVGIGAERFGRKPIFVAGAICTALAALVMAVSPNFIVFLIGRVLAGAAAPMLLLTGQIIVADVSQVANRGKNMAVYQGFFVLGGDIGPLPGGLIADQFGARWTFVGYAVLAFAVAGLALWRLKETRPERPSGEAPARGGHGRARSARTSSLDYGMRSLPFILIVSLGFAFFFTRTGIVQNLMPLFGVETLGLTTTQIGLAFTLGRLPGFLGLFAVGVLADRYGRKVLLVPGAMLSAAALVVWSGADGFALFLAGSIMWGAATSAAGSIPVIYVADIVRPEESARALSVLRTVSDFGYFVGPVLLGAIASVSDYQTAILVAAVVMVIPVLPFALLAPEPVKVRREEEARSA
ncbi:MAG: MFS transporter [Dehalococcoidia bacterium]